MPRLLFEKTGNAIWISHLDLMRLFQRAFKRAGLPLTHTQGFNPRPSVSIALPLSVGVESKCELLDFDLDGCNASDEEIRVKLNASLVDGVRVLQVYTTGRKIRDLTYLHSKVFLEYDKSIAQQAYEPVKELFSRNSVIVPKKTKSGMQDQDLIPMIQSLHIHVENENVLVLDCVACCQNPTLNPAQLAVAVELYLPDYMADFSKCSRVEIFDHENEIFR